MPCKYSTKKANIYSRFANVSLQRNFFEFDSLAICTIMHTHLSSFLANNFIFLGLLFYCCKIFCLFTSNAVFQFFFFTFTLFMIISKFVCSFWFQKKYFDLFQFCDKHFGAVTYKTKRTKQNKTKNMKNIGENRSVLTQHAKITKANQYFANMPRNMKKKIRTKFHFQGTARIQANL